MGVRGLTSLLSRYAPRSIRTVNAKEFAHQTIGFDASCQLNKFIYGEEPHPYRHIYGFYVLTRFCDVNNIKPIFVFDGSYRIPAKKLEAERRRRVYHKTEQSLAYEKDRTSRLDLLSQLSSYQYTYLPEDAAKRILSRLENEISTLEFAHDVVSKDIEQGVVGRVLQKEKEKEKEKEEKVQVETPSLITLEHQALETKLSELADAVQQAVTVTVTEKEEKVQVETPSLITLEHQALETKLSELADAVQQAVATAENREKYTRTVRELTAKERNAMIEMVQEKIISVKASIDPLVEANQKYLASLEKRSLKVTQQIRDECKDFLTALGYVCLTCNNHEAEALCANLSTHNRTTATVSEDLDTIVFGDAPMLRHFFAKHRDIVYIDPVIARQELNMTKEAFIDMCILCGTDFSATIQGIGPIRAMQYIQKYGSIENVLLNLPSHFSPQANFDYVLAREVNFWCFVYY
ncbi:PIN domain-like protein [Spinellus fusiger]|nr:PIN domain-like protein [Spinellus fusiger]